MSENSVIEIVSTTIAFCAIAVTVLPEPKNPTLKKIYQVVNFVAMNFGKARNKGGK